MKKRRRKTPSAKLPAAPRKDALSKTTTKKKRSPARQTKKKLRAAAHHHPHVSKPSLSPTVRAQPLIAVRNVEASSRWYARLLGAENMGGDTHGNLYDRILSRGLLILQLHAWDREDHPNLAFAKAAPIGHGVLVWFELDDFDAAVKRARALRAQVVEEPHVNPGPQHREMWLRDPDGYVVVICSPDGETD